MTWYSTMQSRVGEKHIYNLHTDPWKPRWDISSQLMFHSIAIARSHPDPLCGMNMKEGRFILEDITC